MGRSPDFCAFVRGRLLRQMLKIVPVGTLLAVALMLPRHPVTAVGWLVYSGFLSALIGLGWVYYTIEMWAQMQAPFPMFWKILRIPAFLLLAALPLALCYWAACAGFYARNFV